MHALMTSHLSLANVERQELRSRLVAFNLTEENLGQYKNKTSLHHVVTPLLPSTLPPLPGIDAHLFFLTMKGQNPRLD